MKKNNNRTGLGIIIALLICGALAVGAIALGGSVSSRMKKRFYPIAYVDELTAAADRYGLDRYLVAAIIKTESGFRADAVSAVGAEGLMQVMPSTAEWIASMRGMEYADGSLFEAETNLDYGCWLMRYLLDRNNGSVRNALIAYNAGQGRLEGWLKDGADENGELIEIPYPETRSYVQKVTELTEKYREIYEETLGK